MIPEKMRHIKFRGRAPATGRYGTRAELEEAVRAFYAMPGKSQANVARICKVSETTVARILANNPRKTA